jgi:hypothetical protein
MFRPARLASYALLVVALAAAVAVRPDALADLGLDLSDFPDWLRQLDRELERRESLGRQFRIFQAAELAREQATRDVIAGRLALGQAARRFCDLADRPEPAYRELISRHYPAETSDESLCRLVITWARKLLEDEPSRQEEVCRRLDGELRELFRASKCGE